MDRLDDLSACPNSDAKPHQIGFVALDNRSSIAFPPPRLLRSTRDVPISRRAVQACPAVNTFERRTIEILAPFSIQIRCIEDGKGGYNFHLIEDGTRLDYDLVPHFVSFMPREIWRNDHSPVVQISLPHLFISDLPVYFSQMPPWASDNSLNFPGKFISGRYPADIWPRSLNLAFEWSNRFEDFKMTRGQPASYLFVDTPTQDRKIELVESEMTIELKTYLQSLEDVVKYTSNSFSLFDRARELRPKELIKAKKL